MCYLLLPMQLVPLQECIKLNFSKILSTLFEFFLEKVEIVVKKYDFVRQYFGKNTVNTVVSSLKIYFNILPRVDEV